MRESLNLLEELPPVWHQTQYGDGRVNLSPDGLQLTLPEQDASLYHDAQISDYRSKTDFRWRPPVNMGVVARISGDALVGTAGFGFWNHPFVPGERGLRLPKAVWFFYSASPSNMQLAKAVSGPGWKAATIDASRWQFLLLAPAAPLGVLLMRIPALYERLWPVGQRAVGVSEHLLDVGLLRERHTYRIEWRPDRIHFKVDGVTIHEAVVSIHGPLGFITWIDNQYAVVTPQGQMRFGMVSVPQPQTLLVERITIDSEPVS